MALAAGTSARAHRLIGLVAALLLAAATALAFGRVFIGTETTLKLLAAGARGRAPRGRVRATQPAPRDAGERRRGSPSPSA